MHPREGWLGGGIRRRPDPLDGAISRRQLLAAGAGLMLGGALAGCSSTNPAGAGSADPPLPRQDHPVKWPVYGDNKPIASDIVLYVVSEYLQLYFLQKLFTTDSLMYAAQV